MPDSINVDMIKTRAQRTILEDGLVDIIMGIYLILSGFFLINRALIMNYIWLPVGLALIDMIRRKFIYPRTGYAKVKPPLRIFLEIFLIIVVCILLIGIFVAALTPNFIPLGLKWRGLITYLLTISTMIFFFIIAYRFGFPRWYLYGVLFALAFILHKSLKTPLIVFGVGVIVTLMGVTVFIQYLRKYPILEEANNAS